MSDKRAYSAYLEYFPDKKDFETPLTEEELLTVFAKRFDLNTENPIVREMCLSVGFNYPSIHCVLKPKKQEIIRYFKTSLSIPLETNIRKRTLEYWKLRGWSEEESCAKAIGVKDDYVQHDLNAYGEYIKQAYAGVGIDTNFSIEQVVRLYIRHLIKNMIPNGDIENRILDIALNASCGKLPSQKMVKRAVKEVLSPDGKPTSVFKKDYFILLGYSEDEAIKLVEGYQKKNSKRTLEYWLSRGYSEDEAKAERGKYQKTNSKSAIEYYLSRGYTEDEAIAARTEYIDDLFTNKIGKVSKTGLRFCIMLSEYFSDNDIRFGNHEYFLLNNVDNDKTVRFYDYTDLTLKVVVEYNGNYFHSSRFPEHLENDELKKEIAKRSGFKHYTVWEKDFLEDEKGVVAKLAQLIKGDTNNED